MGEYQILATKSKSYLWMYIISLVLLVILESITLIPLFTIGVTALYVITVIVLGLLIILDIYWLINYLMTPKNLIEISKKDLKIYRKNNKEILIDFKNIENSQIAIGFLSVFMSNTGNILIETKDKNKYRVGYIQEFTKVNGQINSIKYINELGEKIDEKTREN